MRQFPIIRTCLSLIALSFAGSSAGLDLDAIKSAPGAVILADGAAAGASVSLERNWDGDLCRSAILNTGAAPARVREARLFSLNPGLPADSPVYGEGFTMLSQTGGALGEPADLGYYTDRDHYKLPEESGKRTVYGLFTIQENNEGSSPTHHLFGFTSCRRFACQIRFNADTLDIVVDLENLELTPGERVELEEFMVLNGPDRNRLLDQFAARIQQNHPKIAKGPIPTGWCSWYCYGPMVTEKKILDNIEVISKKQLPLRFIQIDDGYQAAMGDWLITGKGFERGLDAVLKEIKSRGFEPAIWVAPFIAEKDSELFKAHPDWFMKDDQGAPLASDKVSFGGWRRGPWFCLDGTHPEVQRHFEELFRTMRSRWDCKYFKLDAITWGTLRGGRLHDPKATRIEAYRRGMEAILRGAGEDGFILGCNHPMWPSLGLIHGSRSSMDVTREWENFRRIAAETFHRNWQNGRLWFNDPDCVLLTGRLPENEYGYHAAAILASGGMILSGDNLTTISEDRLKILDRLLREHPTAAEFNEDMSVGRMKIGERPVIAVFNATDEPRDIDFDLPPSARLTDFWSGAPTELERDPQGRAILRAVAPRSARVLEIRATE